MATVYVASEYNASALEHRFRTANANSSMLAPTANDQRPFMSSGNGTTSLDSLLREPRGELRVDPESSLLELTQSDSDGEPVSGTQVQSAALQLADIPPPNSAASIAPPADPLHVEHPGYDPISPALSYLSLQDPDVEGIASQQPSSVAVGRRQPTLSPYSRLLALSSSDAESDLEIEDSEHHAGPHLPEPHEGLSDAILNGNISGVREYLCNIPSDQRRCLGVPGTSNPKSQPQSSGNSAVIGASDVDSASSDADSDPESVVNPGEGSRTPFGNGGLGRLVTSSPKLPHSRELALAAKTKKLVADGNAVSIIVPKAEHAKGRRFLVPTDKTLPMAAIYMRGDVQFINQRTR